MQPAAYLFYGMMLIPFGISPTGTVLIALFRTLSMTLTVLSNILVTKTYFSYEYIHHGFKCHLIF